MDVRLVQERNAFALMAEHIGKLSVVSVVQLRNAELPTIFSNGKLVVVRFEQPANAILAIREHFGKFATVSLLQFKNA